MRRPKTAEERFWDNLTLSPECWEWAGTRQADGYGQISVGGKKVRAHRFAYELIVGPITSGLVVCHRCDNPTCCRPTHLFLGSQADNMRDMAAKGRSTGGRRMAAKSHCPAGHAYDEANTHRYTRNGSERRRCRACGRARAQSRRDAALGTVTP